MSIREATEPNGTRIVRLESEHLIVEVAPEVGGRVVRFWEKASRHEFLWTNERLKLERLEPGTEYDPNFFGGIDELLPNDLPEAVAGFASPDHGELWTTPLSWRIVGERLVLEGRLPVCGLRYQRVMSLCADRPALEMHYRLTNPTEKRLEFLWKLHAALGIDAGDVIDCPARRAQVVDRAWSRFHSLEPFAWPSIESKAANLVPEKNGTVDFFYLFDLESGRIGWRRPSAGLAFTYHFDPRVFPYVWLFASYGGFDGHYLAILEPCTAMPISLAEAARRGHCSVLEPGQTLETTVTIEAGLES